MHDIPVDLGEISPQWLTAALRDNGFEGEITSYQSEIIGEGAGFLGDIVRIRPQPIPDDPKLLSFILKMPTSLKNRNLGQTLGVYEREIRFYQELQPHLSIRTPVHLYSDMDAAPPEQAIKQLDLLGKMPMWLAKILLPLATRFGGQANKGYVLLLEDLGQYRIGDQLAEGSTADVHLAIDNLAMMHADFYDQPAKLVSYPWIIPFDTGARFMQVMMDITQLKFCEMYEEKLTYRHLEIVNWLVANADSFAKTMSKLPYTLLHGDYRMDNLCFDDANGQLIVFDWQTLLQGPGGYDLAYFISSTKTVVPEKELLERYQHQMSQAGVELSTARIRFEFEMGLLANIQRLLLLATGDIDFGEDRGPALVDDLMARLFQKLEDTDLDGLLSSET